MSKPVLGRGLGELMQGQPVAGRPAAGGATPQAQGELSEGFQRLVNPRIPDADAEARLSRAHQKLARLKPALLVADVALCAVAAWFAFTRGGSLGVGDVVVCVAAVLTGAALGCVGLLLDNEGH